MKTKLLLVCAFIVTTLAVVRSQSRSLQVAQTAMNNGNYCEAAEKSVEAYSKLKVKGARAKRVKGEVAFQTAEAYRNTERYKDANEWYERAVLLDYQLIVPEVLLYNGDMLRMTAEYDKALVNYQEYQKLYPQDPRGELGIQSVTFSKQAISNKTRHFIANQATLNSSAFDMAPVFADKKETVVYFSSSRAGSTGGDLDPISCQNYLDIWMCEIDKKGNWSEPRLADVSGIVNTDAHEGMVSFDGKGKVMFFTRCISKKKQNLGCDIWMTEAKGKGEWTEAKKIELKTIDSVSVGHPCVTDDGKCLLFVSDMPGGFGGKDIWMTTYDKKNDKWSAPVNLGEGINTAGNELFPTFSKDGSLLFSTDGKPGLGGLDLFKAKQVGKEYKWSDPKNMGAPVNSENNDYALYEVTERIGYFTSERRDPEGGNSPDIYKYELPPFNYDLRVIASELGDRSVRISDVKVVVKGSDGKQFEGITGKSGSVYWKNKSEVEKFINEGVTYTITMFKEGFYEDKKGQTFTTVGLSEDQNFIMELSLLPKKPIRLPEVRYPINQWSLLSDSTINSADSLLFVYNLLQEFPMLVLELSSHTDARGLNDANLKLSENRARACYKYLVEQKGIDPRRIVPVGKGESDPKVVYKKNKTYYISQPADMTGVETVKLTEAYINQFKTTDKALYELLHQFNRRTEGRVLSMEFDETKAPPANPNYLQFVAYP